MARARVAWNGFRTGAIIFIGGGRESFRRIERLRRAVGAAASIASASRSLVTICSAESLVRFIFESLLDPTGVRRDSHRRWIRIRGAGQTGWPLKVAGDKEYSYPAIRRWLERRVIEQVLPQRSDRLKQEGRRRLDRVSYKRRARVEQCVGWLKENRRVGTRYDKPATSFQVFVHLAIIQRYLRKLTPNDPSERT